MDEDGVLEDKMKLDTFVYDAWAAEFQQTNHGHCYWRNTSVTIGRESPRNEDTCCSACSEEAH